MKTSFTHKSRQLRYISSTSICHSVFILALAVALGSQATAADETVTGKLTVDQTNTTTALQVDGGFSGSPIAVFRRNDAATAQILIHAGASDPQITIDDLQTGASEGKWSLGVKKSDNSFRVVKAGSLYAATNEYFIINETGEVGIGTTSPTEKLSVNGTIRAKEVIVETTGWADEVFAPGYSLPSVDEVAAHIETEGHLPGVPSAATVADQGIGVGEMQATLLRKIEELTLYVIQQQQEINALKAEVAELRRNNQ